MVAEARAIGRGHYVSPHPRDRHAGDCILGNETRCKLRPGSGREGEIPARHDAIGTYPAALIVQEQV